MSGVEIAMIAIAVVGTAASISAAKTQAKFQAAALAREEEEAREQAELVRIEALQEEALRLEKLRTTKASQRAQAAALGFDPTMSRSFLAIQRDSDAKAREDLQNIRLAGMTGERRFLRSAGAARVGQAGAIAGGKAEMAGAFFSGAGKILGGAKDAGFFKTTTTTAPTTGGPVLGR